VRQGWNGTPQDYELGFGKYKDQTALASDPGFYAGPARIPPGGKVKSVHEAKADFKIEFEDGSSLTFCLANPGSSVAVRDKNNTVEYLG
jgi:hypothetical protein